VRIDEDFALDPRLIPGSMRRGGTTAAEWAKEFAGHSVVVACQKGKKLSEGAAAWLHQEGASAETLAGGTDAWAAQDMPMVPNNMLPPRAAVVAMFRFKVGMIPTIAACSAAGVALYLAGAIS
jgi:rhodanese-related sulfurtransferase